MATAEIIGQYLVDSSVCVLLVIRHVLYNELCSSAYCTIQVVHDVQDYMSRCVRVPLQDQIVARCRIESSGRKAFLQPDDLKVNCQR